MNKNSFVFRINFIHAQGVFYSHLADVAVAIQVVIRIFIEKAVSVIISWNPKTAV